MPQRTRTVEGSCWPCKERRVICDLTLPTCDKCSRTGRRCEYGKVRLRWTDCVASRGRLAGKKFPLQQQPQWHMNKENHLLYFEKELLPRFNLSHTVPHIDLKLLSKDPLLLQSVVAISNAHYAYRSANAQALVLTNIQDRNSALKIFREKLTGTYTNEVQKSLFFANVLLCILDGIIEPSKDTATHHHIVGGKAILKQGTLVKEVFREKVELPLLMLSIFATMDLTHALLIGDQPYFEPLSWADFGGAGPWWGDVKSDDAFIEIIGITSRLAGLGYEVRKLQNTIQIHTLLSIQSSLVQQAHRQDEDKVSGNAAWAAFCSIYRFTASLYLYRALSGLQVDHALVQDAINSSMDIISGQDLPDALRHCILFPLLIIGSHCVRSEHRKVVKSSITRTGVYLSFESLHSLQNFLEKRWSMLDQYPETMQWNWWEYFDEIAKVSCLF